ncbi:MAG TPA: abortive infection family protein [Solirubrobacteraceae bacterium]|nr:abortive infection family protein [Solirubrobacteraceae bacterium]
MELSRRSRQKFADLCAAHGTVRKIEDVYVAHDFLLPAQFEVPPSGQRRAICAAAEEGADLSNSAVQQRLLRVYLDAIDDFGRKASGGFAPLGEEEDPLWDEARTLVRTLRRDGAPIDDNGELVLGATPSVLPIERFDRLSEPRVLLDHLARIEAGIDSDPAGAIGSAKELVESVCKFILDDYGVTYKKAATLPDLYGAVATELGLARESVPESAKGSQAAQKILQNLMTAVQQLAELRNELGRGHGRTKLSPAYAWHARLSANAARTVVEFLLETWHARRSADGAAATT